MGNSGKCIICGDKVANMTAHNKAEDGYPTIKAENHKRSYHPPKGNGTGNSKGITRHIAGAKGQPSENITIAAEEYTATAQDDALAVNLKDAKK